MRWGLSPSRTGFAYDVASRMRGTSAAFSSRAGRGSPPVGRWGRSGSA